MIGVSTTSRVILAICFMALLALLSLAPARPHPGDSAFLWLVAKTPSILQKLLHVGLYAVLALLLVWIFSSIQSRTYRFLISWGIAVTFGAIMEWQQTKVPGRFGSALDVALNAVGAALGLVAATFVL